MLTDGQVAATHSAATPDRHWLALFALLLRRDNPAMKEEASLDVAMRVWASAFELPVEQAYLSYCLLAPK